MNYINHAVLLLAVGVTAQYNSGQYADQFASASSIISQDRQESRATVSSYAQDQGYNAQVPESVKENVSDSREKRQDAMMGRRASASAVYAEQGFSSVPADVRQAHISSMAFARSSQFDNRRNDASAFMATQTNINTASLAAAVSSYTATATAKPMRKGRFNLRRETKTKAADIQATTTGLSNGFKNFFKSLQLKIQKTSTASIVAPSPTAN